MNNEQRQAVIAELDELVPQARAIAVALDHLMSRQSLYQDANLCQVSAGASRLIGTLMEVNDALKRAGTAYIQACVIDWYRFRVELDVPEKEVVDPTIEALTYDGRDTWTVRITTPTHGRERVVLHSDGTSWSEVYSAHPV